MRIALEESSVRLSILAGRRDISRASTRSRRADLLDLTTISTVRTVWHRGRSRFVWINGGRSTGSGCLRGYKQWASGRGVDEELGVHHIKNVNLTLRRTE